VKNKVKLACSYYQSNQGDLFEEFIQFLRIPSISTVEVHKQDIQEAADYLVNKLKQIGLTQVQAIPTPRHPIVYGEYIVDSQKPTLLLYGHYDVQPPDPLDKWETAPFEPRLNGQYVYARGASDMKGQVWALISALEAILSTSEVSVNVKILIEGEEEIGSPSLESFLVDNKQRLACDVVLNTDGGMLAPDNPTIIYALRGMAYFELRIDAPKADLHSGIFGGVVANPANILANILAGMQSDDGHVELPGFYDNVRQISPDEKAELLKTGMDEAFYLETTGVPMLWGENEFSPVERVGARPTLDVNGLYSGYINEGAKTIIPAYAMAKFSTRLVPDQNPEDIHKSVRTYLTKHVPETVRWKLKYLSGSPAYIIEDDVPGVDLYINALRETWGKEPLRKREGGSIPVAMAMKKILGVDSIISGFGLPGDQIHSPNERMHLPTHQKGVQALIRFFLGF
jgi:acetylornithine deacetylase/succinyl-diaminopimelate desuccinylase-like protein